MAQPRPVTEGTYWEYPMATMAVAVVVWLAFNVFVAYRFLRNAKTDAASAVNDETYVSEPPISPRIRVKREARRAA